MFPLRQRNRALGGLSGGVVLTAFCVFGFGSEPALNTVAQLRTATRLELNRGKPFTLSGIVTLGDREGNRFVLQDTTGAMAIHPDCPVTVQPGQKILLRAHRGVPFFVGFPDYPFHPSGSDIRTNFEAPSNWGDFHLTRMAGYLRPPVTGQYTFWIASDNSSELWLSSDEDPCKVRNIASVKAGMWVNEREWARYPSQQSEPMRLEAGRDYYIEAFGEQLQQADHLAVAWQGPGIEQSVIDGQYLTPWREPSPTNGPQATTDASSGVLRQYWTNFSIGNLAPITGSRTVESVVRAQDVTIEILQTNVWPKAMELDLTRPLSRQDNFAWVETEGTLSFSSREGGRAMLELKSGSRQTMIQVADWEGNFPTGQTNWQARVRGVCEGATDAGHLMPATIWATSRENIAFSEVSASHELAPQPDLQTSSNASSRLGGFFIARGVVTFKDRVLGKEILVVQDATSGVFVSPIAPGQAPELRVGQAVEIGGDLLPATHAPRLRPRIVVLSGPQIFPEPANPNNTGSLPDYVDGVWTEIEGVVSATSRNGVLLVRTRNDLLQVWVGRADGKELESWVNARVRVRGVMALEGDVSPLLMAPSPGFVDVTESAPKDQPVQNISGLNPSGRAAHRVRVAGLVTYRDDDLLFVQDGSGAAEVQNPAGDQVQVGDFAEVLGFADQVDSLVLLSQAVLKRIEPKPPLQLRPVDAEKSDANTLNGTLVRIEATLFSHQARERGQALELQAGHRLVQAFLPGQWAASPMPAPGTVLRLTGVGLFAAATPRAEGGRRWESAPVSVMRVLLREPRDVAVVRGPPWWNWKRGAAVIGLLVASLAGVTLKAWVTRRRFEKQQVARSGFARQLLEQQENERRRIAANLHDSLGQNLLAIKSQAHLALQPDTDGSGMRKRLEDISGTVLNALEEVRQITHDLRPYQLDRLGLAQSLRALVRRSSEHSSVLIATHVDDIDGLFPGVAEISIYRIVQEGLNNIIKHSGATEAAVVIKRETGALAISIRDNGRGLDPATANGAAAAGFGLSGIEERARILGGTMSVDAPVGAGFNLKIEIPISPKCNQN